MTVWTLVIDISLNPCLGNLTKYKTVLFFPILRYFVLVWFGVRNGRQAFLATGFKHYETLSWKLWSRIAFVSYRDLSGMHPIWRSCRRVGKEGNKNNKTHLHSRSCIEVNKNTNDNHFVRMKFKCYVLKYYSVCHPHRLWSSNLSYHSCLILTQGSVHPERNKGDR